MDLSLNARELDIQQRSRKLCDDVLLPLEIPCDEQDGLSPAELKDAYQAIIDAKLNAVNMREEWGGQGLSLFEQVLSQEQLGRSTNALWDIVWRPANVLKYCTPEQRERFLIPEIAGKRRSCYAITEENAVERFYRDLRVDRIWEGTSEIQKVVLVNEMRKRGTSPVAAWPKQA